MCLRVTYKAVSGSVENAAHAAAHALPVVQHVELVHQVVHHAAALGEDAQVGDQADVVRLLFGECFFCRFKLF